MNSNNKIYNEFIKHFQYANGILDKNDLKNYNTDLEKISRIEQILFTGFRNGKKLVLKSALKEIKLPVTYI